MRWERTYTITMIPRFFCSDALPSAGEYVLPADVSHHVGNVLRMQPGDALTLFDGDGSEVAATLLGSGRPLRVALGTRTEPQRESPLAIVLVQALASGDKMDWVIQKAVELGVAAIIPLVTERCVLKLSGERAEKRLRHWRQIAVSACEQCGRNRIPPVDAQVALDLYLLRADAPRRLVLAPGGGARLGSLPVDAGPVHLMVGPEGGWSERELAIIRTAGCTPIVLGPRILRTETAGLAAVAALQALWGDL